MTSKLTREQATDSELQMLIDSHEKGTAMFLRVDAYYLIAKELQERRKAAMGSEPTAWKLEGGGAPDHVTLDERVAHADPLRDVTALYEHPPAQQYPESLPCPVILEPGFRFGKGVNTRLMLRMLQRRAERYAELDAMEPEARAEHDAAIAELREKLGFGAQQNAPQNIPEIISEKEDPMKPADREYIVNCYSYTGSAWLHAGKNGPAWHFKDSDLLVDNDEVTVIRKVVDDAEVK